MKNDTDEPEVKDPEESTEHQIVKTLDEQIRAASQALESLQTELNNMNDQHKNLLHIITAFKKSRELLVEQPDEVLDAAPLITGEIQS